jgi:hypothetical protein
MYKTHKKHIKFQFLDCILRESDPNSDIKAVEGSHHYTIDSDLI